jgi:tRNA-binding EMAP/Myf-like protein
MEQIDIRVGTIWSVEEVAGSDKLMSEVAVAETLGHVRRFSLGASLVVYPALVVAASTVDHQLSPSHLPTE